ncbi:Uncharacterized protein Adt_33490 [Abeliophyllum distichum]|uniref:Uncharacterized protein n=1 Tax=Abeliophyllum distichum TaxID=126358 RepID=A0ABD1QXC3_9LAMI
MEHLSTEQLDPVLPVVEEISQFVQNMFNISLQQRLVGWTIKEKLRKDSRIVHKVPVFNEADNSMNSDGIEVTVTTTKGGNVALTLGEAEERNIFSHALANPIIDLSKYHS